MNDLNSSAITRSWPAASLANTGLSVPYVASTDLAMGVPMLNGKQGTPAGLARSSHGPGERAPGIRRAMAQRISPPSTLAGRVVRNWKANTAQVTLDVRELAPGNYPYARRPRHHSVRTLP